MWVASYTCHVQCCPLQCAQRVHPVVAASCLTKISGETLPALGHPPVRGINTPLHRSVFGGCGVSYLSLHHNETGLDLKNHANFFEAADCGLPSQQKRA